MPGGAGFPPSTTIFQTNTLPQKNNILDPHTASLDFRKIISCGVVQNVNSSGRGGIPSLKLTDSLQKVGGFPIGISFSKGVDFQGLWLC